MGDKLVQPVPPAKSGAIPPGLETEKRAAEMKRAPVRAVSRDPLYETDRYRLVTPLAPKPKKLDETVVQIPVVE